MSFTFKTIQGTYPGAGAGSRITFALSQAMSDGAGTQIEAVTRTMYLDDLTGVGSISIAANDDVSTNPVGTYYVVTEHINGAPERQYWITISTAMTSPIQLATIPHASVGTTVYGVADITSSTLTVTKPSPGIVNIEDPGGGGGGSGTVTSVGLTGDGTVFNATVPGSPVTTSGNFAPTLHTQTANTVFAGPTTGAAAASAFRALVAADLPAATTAAQGAAVLATPSSDVTAGHVVQASDARLSDARPPSTPTTKGDLVGFSTVPARVPVGTNGQQLIADSTQALGLRWDAIVKEFSWTATGYGYFQAGTAMTLDQAVTPNGTFAYDRAVAGALGTFSSVSLPVTLAAGDVLRVNCSALANSYGALVLKRVA